jgi:rRNA maturation endonuclease Nob1
MIFNEYDVVAASFQNTGDIPKDDDLFYRCTGCGAVIPSAPEGNMGYTCGNVFIDKDCWQLIVADLSRFEVVKIRSA